MKLPNNWQVYVDKSQKEVKKLLKSLKITVSETKTPKVGSRPIAKSTEANYNYKYINFTKFCMMIGDYESQLMMMDKGPIGFCPSVKAETMLAFCRFQRYKKDEVVIDSKKNVIVDIITKRPIMGLENWKTPISMEMFLSSMTAIHGAREQQGQYKDKCKACFDIFF